MKTLKEIEKIIAKIPAEIQNRDDLAILLNPLEFENLTQEIIKAYNFTEATIYYQKLDTDTYLVPGTFVSVVKDKYYYIN